MDIVFQREVNHYFEVVGFFLKDLTGNFKSIWALLSFMKILTTQVSICFFLKFTWTFFPGEKLHVQVWTKFISCLHENCSCRQHVNLNICETADNNQEPSQRMNNELLMDVTGL